MYTRLYTIVQIGWYINIQAHLQESPYHLGDQISTFKQQTKTVSCYVIGGRVEICIRSMLPSSHASYLVQDSTNFKTHACESNRNMSGWIIMHHQADSFNIGFDSFQARCIFNVHCEDSFMCKLGYSPSMQVAYIHKCTYQGMREGS